MTKETLTPKERWLKTLKREKTDRIPMDYWATGETTEKLMKHLNCNTESDIYRKLHIDKVMGVGPEYTGPKLPENTDIFGCKYKTVDYGSGIYGECIYHPITEYKTVKEIKENYKWPEPDWCDYSKIKAQIEGKEDYPIQGGGSEPFLTYKYLRGDEQAFVDLIENPEIVNYCLDKLFDMAYQNTLRIYEQIPGKVMLSYVAEDFGSQDDLMCSPQQIKEYFIPRMKRMMDLAHSAGAYVFHHSDGAVRKIIPDMIEAGIDALNPIQWKCRGMDREGLKRDFGDKLIFHGGVDNQHTLPFGTKEEVKQEVIDNIRILGKGGGYILAPCHNIQSVTPPENIVEMYKTGYEYGTG
ncbi:MAG: uroporphyrinogen-III decarboxylase-like protein [Elusimicrobia bacterium CG1_02_37_114]|nr:MAG: uroporphyrinogen-III decarboxylase-like protein [Elusimicrobia bacterium CG1_02_37_114]PIV53460.1 MAG: uroporphyrinogen-III decarboxylase-like protein [Elusimicrobia bacterium CG02_land_8_20_14_3_00_37_13]PIZ12745.1 MAG: uroporphyrinogen-III decarboxylase-like protein [Elusimicrobia bacterium CG_4_10_14_0_8_um_filter_37_32]